MAEIQKSNKEILEDNIRTNFGGDTILSRKDVIKATGSFDIDKVLTRQYDHLNLRKNTSEVFLEGMEDYLENSEITDRESYYQLVNQMLEQVKINGFRSVQYFAALQADDFKNDGIKIDIYNPLTLISITTMMAYKYRTDSGLLSSKPKLEWKDLETRDQEMILARCNIYDSSIFAPENLDNLQFEDLDLVLLQIAFPMIDNLEGLLKDAMVYKNADIYES